MGRKQRNVKAGQKIVSGLWLHEDGEYRYRFMRRGRLYTGNTECSDPKGAREYLADLKTFLRQEERGQVSPQPPTPPAPPPPITLRELVALWEATKCNRSKSHLQTTTGAIRNHFPGLLDTPVVSITTLQVNQAMATYMTTKGVNPGRGGTHSLREHTARGANKVLERFRDVIRFGVAEKVVASFQFNIEFLKEEEVQKHVLPLRWVDKFFSLIDRAKNQIGRAHV